jgi:tetratricopeptide (TPR) repeat protein
MTQSETSITILVINLIAICVAVAAVALVIWRRLDMRFILKLSQRKAQLSIEGRWRELGQYFETTPKIRRPFVWLHYHYRFPGSFTVQHALFLYKLGHLDEALSKADLAIQEASGEHPIFWFFRPRRDLKTKCNALRARALALNALGKADEARETAERLKKLTGRPETIMALIEYNSGHLDEALAEAAAIPAESTRYDVAQNIIALVYRMKGEFQQAIQTLSREPRDVTKFYKAADLETMRASTEGAKLLELRQKKHAGVFQPSRFLQLSEVYLNLEDFKNADLALDRAEKSLGSEPGIQASYCRLRACSFAGQGKAVEAENYLDRLRAIATERPKRSLVSEAHSAAGKSYFYLHRFTDALTELSEAQNLALHPIEKHVTAYWIARTHEAAGDRDKAIPFYQAVASDSIPSWMRKKAAEALGQ